MLYSVREIHSEVSKITIDTYPNVVYTLAYQDGIIHALDRFLQMYSTGTYNTPGHISHLAKSYEQLSKDAYAAGNYWNFAYYEGYLNGLILIDVIEDDFEAIKVFPLYFIPLIEKEIHNLKEFMSELKKSCKKENEYLIYAKQIASRYGSPDMVVHHPPY